MVLFEQPNLTGGIDDAMIDIARTVPSFPIGILLFTFITVFLGGALNQQRKTGYTDYPLWSVMASLSTLVVSLIMTIKEGIISNVTLGIVVSICILSGFWFFMSKGRNEQ